MNEFSLVVLTMTSGPHVLTGIQIASGAAASSSRLIVREPTPEPWATLHKLQEIPKSSKPTGCLDYEYGQAGSLLRAVEGDEGTVVEEFASMSVDNVTRAINTIWRRSAINVPGDGEKTYLDAIAPELTNDRAMAAHNCARIWSGYIWPRGQSEGHARQEAKAAADGRDAKLAALQVPAAMVAPTPHPAVSSATVAIKEVADFTMIRSVYVMDTLAFQQYLRNYKKWCHVPPAPEVAPRKSSSLCSRSSRPEPVTSTWHCGVVTRTGRRKP